MLCSAIKEKNKSWEDKEEKRLAEFSGLLTSYYVRRNAFYSHSSESILYNFTNMIQNYFLIKLCIVIFFNFNWNIYKIYILNIYYVLQWGIYKMHILNSEVL